LSSIANRQTDTPTNKQTDRQINKQTEENVTSLAQVQNTK